jgi:hypothetical protein
MMKTSEEYLLHVDPEEMAPEIGTRKAKNKDLPSSKTCRTFLDGLLDRRFLDDHSCQDSGYPILRLG